MLVCLLIFLAFIPCWSSATPPWVRLPHLSPSPNPPPKISPIPDFVITGFQAGGIIMSHRSYINFNVLTRPNAALVYCSTFGTTLTASISSITPTWCNRQPDSPPTSEDVWFDLVLYSDAPPPPHYNSTDNITSTATTSSLSPMLTAGPDGGDDRKGALAKLRVVRQINNGTRDQAVHYILPQDAPFIGDGDFFHQVYVGPENFTVKAWRYEMQGL
ncbi:hypothetical protein QBC38DRAFT_473290 [Podospora fimiseda]|uniref:Ubiquitin 3 binding protein But2 C-terminal domain-containing protein n=1 Tax=Podospora fimiseda TaxID=252190 RepID=A0AAN7BT24_9PEZI|nr:hypothetical protein QBC38DRAFT_473290 [Podospora fimiseda]